MSNDDDARFLDYIAELRARVAERCLELGDRPVDAAPTAFREDGFTSVVLDVLEDLGQVVDPEVCYLDRRFGRYAAKLNAWSYREDERSLDLISTIHNDLSGAESIPGGQLFQAASRALRVFLAATDPVHLEMEPASSAYDMMLRLHEIRDEIERVRIILLADGSAGELTSIGEEEQGLNVGVDVWDLRRLFRAESAGLTYESINIDLVDRLGEPLRCLVAPSSDGAEYQTFLTIIPGELLYKLYHELGPRLLELNVRSFLQARGKVNRGIRDTLRDEPERFLAYNNGISATVEKLDIAEVEGGGKAIRSFKGFQVVNGGQTVASIHRAKDRDKQDISDVFVQAKITQVQKEQIETLVPQISRYANTQNRVNEADFSANHPFHVRIQQLSETVWAPGEQHRWFYERARGQYQVAKAREATTPARKRRFDATTPPRQRFDKVLLAKYVNSWGQLPHIVSRGSQKNFVDFMLRLSKAHGDQWEPDADYYKELIAKAIIYKRAEKIARMHKFPGYRANAVTYTIALISYRTAGRVDLHRIWDQQECSQALADTMWEWMLHVWGEFTASAGQRNVTEWCKKEECWRSVQTLALSLPPELEAELATGQPLPTVGDSAEQKGVGLTPEDRENIARVMQVPVEDWVSLTGWGSRTGLLEHWQIGIATTLATYSAANWTKVPSKKQAMQGVAMLMVAEEHSAWPDPDD